MLKQCGHPCCKSVTYEALNRKTNKWYLCWLCPTTVLASESWLALLVRISGSELVTDSVSLFCQPKRKRKICRNEWDTLGVDKCEPLHTEKSRQVFTSFDWTNLWSRCNAEAAISTDLGLFLLCISCRRALLLRSFRPCNINTLLSPFSPAEPRLLLTLLSFLAQSQRSTETQQTSEEPELLQH